MPKLPNGPTTVTPASATYTDVAFSVNSTVDARTGKTLVGLLARRYFANADGSLSMEQTPLFSAVGLDLAAQVSANPTLASLVTAAQSAIDALCMAFLALKGKV